MDGFIKYSGSPTHIIYGLMIYLSGLSHNWNNFLGLAMLNYNSYTFPNMDRLSPFECVQGGKVKSCPSLEASREVVLTGTLRHTTLDKSSNLPILESTC